MSNTPNLELPLVSSSQSQKHITVNESLVLLDALVLGQLSDHALATAPNAPDEGALYTVAAGAVGDWVGQDNNLAIWSEGGWRFLPPQQGWTFHAPSDGHDYRFDGSTWSPVRPLAVSDGASLGLKVKSFDHVVSAGLSSTTIQTIPNHAHVIGVSAKVITDITTDTGADWSLGVSDDANRYGTGLGFALASTAKGVTGTGVTYYSDTALVMTCNGGAFTGGAVRFAIHYLDITEPE